jgi:rhodanese-related sulfurtransferase
VPGALSLPRDDFEAAYARISEALPKDRTVVAYCASETCVDAGLVRAALVKLGHARVVIFHGGGRSGRRPDWRRKNHHECENT